MVENFKLHYHNYATKAKPRLKDNTAFVIVFTANTAGQIHHH